MHYYTAECPKCGEVMICTETTTTCVGYFSPDNHNHDDNCRKRVYMCGNGHHTAISKRNRCPVEGCDWVGRDECFCHPHKKVEEWPKPYKEKTNGLK